MNFLPSSLRPLGQLVVILLSGILDSRAADLPPGAELFQGPVPRIEIEIPPEGWRILREYNQQLRQPRPERVDVSATVRQGQRVYTNVAVHLKGSWSFQPVEGKPSLTLNFDKFAKGQRFHGLTKIHLNNSVQDDSYLCEQFGRELFAAVGVPSPRAGPALLRLNQRELGLYVLIEGANKTFVKNNFSSAQGNLYDGGSGGDVTKTLEADSGEQPENRADLTNLVRAAREPDPAQRLARLQAVLDVDRFISFAATEDFIVHWDGYAIGCNNYRLFHDAARDKMIFMPGGLDQLFGRSSSVQLPLTPVFKGMVAKALFSIPEARRRYLDRIAGLSTNEFRVDLLHARVDRLAGRVRGALVGRPAELAEFNDAVDNLKERISQRAVSVASQLRQATRPVRVADDTPIRLTAWSYKSGSTQPAQGQRVRNGGQDWLRVAGRGDKSSGAWRTTLLLDAGHYELTARARTEGMTTADLRGTNGVILRVSGERSTKGMTVSEDWQTLRYEFDVRGIEDVEIVCEFRGSAPAAGLFEADSVRLFRRGPARNRVAAGEEP